MNTFFSDPLDKNNFDIFDHTLSKQKKFISTSNKETQDKKSQLCQIYLKIMI